MGSIEEKLISRETARHFRIFFGTLASCSVSGMLRSSFPCKEPVINMFPHIFKHFYLNITGRIFVLQQRHFWVILSITFTVSMCSKSKYLLRLPLQGKMPCVIHVSTQCFQINLTCHKIFPVSASRRFIQFTRNPERMSSAFAGIVMSYEQVSPVKTGMEKVYVKLRL